MATVTPAPAPRDPVQGAGGAQAPGATNITPPHSANGKKDAPNGVPSELSDLELDPKAEKEGAAPEKEEGEEEEIEPDHFYGDGKIPVFKPVSDPPMAMDVLRRLTWTDDGPVPGFPEVHQHS